MTYLIIFLKKNAMSTKCKDFNQGNVKPAKLSPSHCVPCSFGISLFQISYRGYSDVVLVVMIDPAVRMTSLP